MALHATGPYGLAISMGIELFATATSFASKALENFEKMKEQLFGFLNEAKEALFSY